MKDVFMRWTWTVVLALAAGCDGIQLEQLVKQHPALTRMVSEPAGAHCPHGGSALLSGLDLDDNGQLDDSEVTRTDYACATALTRKELEPAGLNCALGGQAVRTGVDVDGSGVLDDAEVTATEYLCITSLPDVLVRTQPMPPDDKCPHGGQVARAGHDANGNGTLEDGEVTRVVYGCTQPETVVARVRASEPPPFVCAGKTATVEAGPDSDGNGVLTDGESRARVELCADAAEVLVQLLEEPMGPWCGAGGTWVRAGVDKNRDGSFDDQQPVVETYVCTPLHTYFGNYTVKTAADLAALQGISHIRGHLFIENTELTNVTLPGLSVVEGQVTISSNPLLTQLYVPGLRFVGHSLQVTSHPLLESLTLGGNWNERLWVETYLEISSNPRLKSLNGLAFVSPRVGLGLQDNDALQFVPGQPGFAAIQFLSGTLLVSGNDALQAIPFPNLQQVGGNVQIVGNKGLESLRGTSLAAIGGDLWVTDNDALESLWGMSSLHTLSGWLSVSGNDKLLTTGGLEGVDRMGGLLVSDNAALEWVGDMPSLQAIRFEFDLRENPKLLGLRNLGGLLYISQLTLADNLLLTDLSPLARVTRLEKLTVERSPALTSLGALAALREVMDVKVAENANLTRLDLGALQQVSQEFFVTDNPKLPTCLVTPLMDAVHTGHPDLRRVSGNDDAATCGN